MEYCMLIKTFLFIHTVYIHPTSAASHSLQYFYTAVTPGIDFPEFTAVGLVDGDQIVYYDSDIRKMIPKAVWMEKNVGNEYWSTQTQVMQGSQKNFQVGMNVLMQRFNHTEGTHSVQVMYGCENADDDGTSKGYWKFGYDGEDFLSLDLNTLTWTAANAKAVITKQRWERTGDAIFQKAYLEDTCIKWLKTYMGYGRSTLERRVPPEISLFQKNSSSPVVCHATGFFPIAVMISWKKNGEDLDKGVELRETLPNQDGTFQRRSILTVPPEELDRNHYTCIIQHSSLEKVMVIPFKTGVSGGESLTVAGLVVVVLPLVIGCSGLFIWKKGKMVKSGLKLVQDSSS